MAKAALAVVKGLVSVSAVRRALTSTVIVVVIGAALDSAGCEFGSAGRAYISYIDWFDFLSPDCIKYTNRLLGLFLWRMGRYYYFLLFQKPERSGR